VHLEPIDETLTQIGAAAAARETAKLRTELQEAKDELLASKLEAESELADGARKLTDAATAISEGEQELVDQEQSALQELADRKADLEAGREELAEGWDLYRTELSRWKEGDRDWQDNRAILDATKNSLDDALVQITAGEQELAVAKEQLDAALLQLDQLTCRCSRRMTCSSSQPRRVRYRLNWPRLSSFLLHMMIQICWRS